jgi:hypothetical protein
MKKIRQLTAIEIKLGVAAYAEKRMKVRVAMELDSTLTETRRACKIAASVRVDK